MTTELLPSTDVDKLRWDSIPAQSQQQFNALLHDEEFTNAANCRDQVGIVCRTPREEEDEPASRCP
jgi:protein-arginine kinase activator protein McsA